MADESQDKKQEKREKKPEGTAPADDAVQPQAAPEGALADEGAAAPAKKVKVRNTKAVPMGIAHIKATFNNTFVSITDPKGGIVAWSSSGRAGFKGSRKSTAFAATMVGQDAGKQAVARGMHEVEIRVQGAGAGRESAIRAIQAAGLNITLIRDVTPIPHDGCRARKRRRV